MAQSTDNGVGAVNAQTLGVSMPTVTLSNGQVLQTGTVGALLVNIAEYDRITAENQGQAAQTPEVAAKQRELEKRMLAALPMLHKVGLFNLFTPDEWSNTTPSKDSPGRRFVGLEARKRGF